jgi:hypothetical protein
MRRPLVLPVLWSLGSVAGMEIEGAAFFVVNRQQRMGEPGKTWYYINTG